MNVFGYSEDHDLFTSPVHGVSPDPRVFRVVPVKEIEIDATVQRDTSSQTSQNTINMIAANFSWSLFEVPTVAERNGGRLYVAEGQHRILALKKLDLDAQVMVAILPEGLITRPGEAGIARDINDGRRRQTPVEVWKLEVVKGSRHEILGNEVLAKLGLELGGYGPHQISAVSALSDCLHAKFHNKPEEGAEHLEQVLRILLASWDESSVESKHRFNGVVIHAVSALFHRYKHFHLDEDRLVTTLATQKPQYWLDDAKQRIVSPYLKLASQIVVQYNSKLRTRRLPPFDQKKDYSE